MEVLENRPNGSYCCGMKITHVAPIAVLPALLSCSKALEQSDNEAIDLVALPELDSGIGADVDAAPEETDVDEEDEVNPDADADVDVDYLDPFERYPDTSEGLVNTSSNLRELLEFGELDSACDAWRANPDSRRLKLMCGKWMFFYEGFGTMGIPTPLIDWVGRNFPDSDEAGLAFTNYGLVQDPYHSTHEQPRPLGIGVGAPLGGTDTMAFTCANCHFGQMPDGRYSVGYPNLEYDYGKHMLALFMVPMKGMPGFNSHDHHPEAVAATQPLLERFDEDPFLALGMAMHMLPMLAGGMPDTPNVNFDDQGRYASWKKGTMDFAIEPLPIEDDVHTVSRIQSLWHIPTVERQRDYGMDSAFLAWTGSARSLEEFLSGFVIIGGGPLEEWGPENLDPLREYIESLRAPKPLNVEDPVRVDNGRALFRESGCEDCHSGPSGSGVEIFMFDEVGTDDVMQWWGDGDRDGEMCCGVDGELTGGIKAPRLRGLHALNLFLHNGSIESLEELLCIEERPPSLEPPFANTGHEYGCDLPEDQRHDLIAFLKSL